MKRQDILNQINEIAQQIYNGEDLSESEALFRRLFKDNNLIYSKAYLRAFLEGMIFASGVSYVDNVKTMSLIVALINK
jgi:hypothetical protein